MGCGSSRDAVERSEERAPESAPQPAPAADAAAATATTATATAAAATRALQHTPTSTATEPSGLVTTESNAVLDGSTCTEQGHESGACSSARAREDVVLEPLVLVAAPSPRTPTGDSGGTARCHSLDSSSALSDDTAEDTRRAQLKLLMHVTPPTAPTTPTSTDERTVPLLLPRSPTEDTLRRRGSMDSLGSTMESVTTEGGGRSKSKMRKSRSSRSMRALESFKAQRAAAEAQAQAQHARAAAAREQAMLATHGPGEEGATSTLSHPR